MSKWNLSIVAAALVTLASQVLVTAQIRQPMPVPAQARQPMPLAAPEPNQALQRPVKRQMPQPGTEQPNAGKVQGATTFMHNKHGRPYMAVTAEGVVRYKYSGDQLTTEQFDRSDVTGTYSYDRRGRFERIDYSDGLVITANYGSQDELHSLTSSRGETIEFNYPADEYPLRTVTPTENFYELHSAVAMLRLKTPPVWWPKQPAMEQAVDPEDKGEKRSPSDNGWGDTPEYPHDPFPETEKTPDGTSIIPVPGERLPENPRQPSPMWQPKYQDPVEPKPRGGGGGGGGTRLVDFGKDLREVVDLGRREIKIQICRDSCTTFRGTVETACTTGPTRAAIDRCFGKIARFARRCANSCDKEDFDHDFQKTMPRADKDFTPWDPKAEWIN